MKIYAIVFSLFLSLALAVSSHASNQLVNGSFESIVAGTGGDNSMAFPYPQVADWTYAGTPRSKYLGAINQAMPAIPSTPHGNNWLLLDNRIGRQHI